jgi:DNA-directed RNA polymerase subunit F
MIYYLLMDKKRVMLDGLVVKQAVRDIASKKPDLSDKALLYFYSRDFSNLCKRNKIDGNAITQSVKELVDFPIISRKKIANDIAKVIDNSFVEEVVSK